MGSRDYYLPGSWNIACAECGRKRKAHEVVKNWQGMWKCPEHNEARHPQDYVRAVPDMPAAPYIQLECDSIVGVCFPNDITALVDYAQADCAIVDYIHPAFDPNVSEL